jgi:signal transduction histidine kinase
MRLSPQALLPKTICWQIMAFAALSLILGNAITFIIVSHQFRDEQRLLQQEAVATIIATFAGLLAPAETQSEFSKLIAQGRALGIAVREVPNAQLGTLYAEQGAPEGFAKAVAETGAAERVLTVLSRRNLHEVGANSVLVRLSNDRVLSFDLPSDTNRPSLLGGPALLTASIAAAFILVLTTYVLWSITSPLSLFAAAAEAFGRSLKDGQPLREKGPREIAQLARVLNTMRSRIASLIEGRTSMLIAIGHDLRTPLTRIVLQAERLPASPMRRAMLSDLTNISELLSNMLSYLRGEPPTELRQDVDLSSLVQTVCSQFADRGRLVTYEGCDHLVYSCRPNGLARALSFIVEACVEHNWECSITLDVLPSGEICIDICPPETRGVLLERRIESLGECGLRLSLAETTIEGHGGTVQLGAIATHCLCARITLPTVPCIGLSDNAAGNIA